MATKSKFKIDPDFKEEIKQEFKVSGEKLVTKVRQLIKEGNARKIIIKDEKGRVLLEFPLTIGAVGVLVAPLLAAIGALAALVSQCTIVVVKEKKK